MVAHIYKALSNILTSDKFDTFSSNFYQHQNFYNLLMSSPGKNNVTYKSIEPERVVVGYDLTRLRFSFPRNFSTKRQIRYARKTKVHDIFFFSTF